MINHTSDITNSGLSRTIALIEQIMGGARYTSSLVGIGELLNDLTKHHPFVRYSMGHDFQVYRGRIHEDEHFYLNISELSYNKPEDTKAMAGVILPVSPFFILLITETPFFQNLHLKWVIMSL